MLLLSVALRLALALNPPIASPALAVVDSKPAAMAPSTQPAATQADPNIVETFSNTRLGQLAQGKRQVSLNEIKDPSFWLDTIKDLIVAVIGFVPRLIVSLCFLVVFWGIYRALRKILLASLAHAHVDDSIRDLLTKAVRWSVMGFGIVIACNQVGIPIVAMLTGVSIIGLAVGFAAQETLANFIAGVVIFWDKPFRVGDIIAVDGTFGEVQRVTFRSTRLITGDGEMVVMPNTAMLANKLINNTATPTVRVRVPIGIAYRESIDRARQVLLPVMQNDERIKNDPEPCVVVTECAASSVNLELRFWIKEGSQMRAMYFEIMEKAKASLDAAGIQIPYPHLQLFVEDTPALSNLRQPMTLAA
jgi:small conductance mechanosensitive channel